MNATNSTEKNASTPTGNGQNGCAAIVCVMIVVSYPYFIPQIWNGAWGFMKDPNAFSFDRAYLSLFGMYTFAFLASVVVLLALAFEYFERWRRPKCTESNDVTKAG